MKRGDKADCGFGGRPALDRKEEWGTGRDLLELREGARAEGEGAGGRGGDCEGGGIEGAFGDGFCAAGKEGERISLYSVTRRKEGSDAP